ncbi:MAG: UbiA family prenyltransferase, partial [Pseudomonadales bacterium]
MKPLADYHPIKALRPFSLVVALIGAGLGVLLALLEGHSDLWRGALIVVAALMAQAGINLINDVEDLKTVDKLNRATRRRILSNTKIAALLFALCFATAGYFAALHGWQVWVYSLAIALLTLSYNLGPLNFKSRGLSLFHVFLLTGVLLVQGAYFA